MGKVRPPVLRVQNEKIITRHITAVALSEFFRAFPKRFRDVESLIKDWDKPSAVADLKDFLFRNLSSLEERLTTIITSERMRREVGLDSGEWIEKVAGGCSRFSLAEAEVCNDFRNARKFEKESCTKRDYTSAE